MKKDKTLADKIIFIDNLLDSTFSLKTYLYYRDIIEKLNSLQHDKDYLLEEIERLNNIINKLELALELNIEDLKEYSEMQSRVDEDKEILRFIKELKGSDK